MAAKRSRQDDGEANAAGPSMAKRSKLHDSKDHISLLSDELLIRIWQHFPIHDLITTQRLSKRFSRISIDGQLWKSLYYERFVRPRAMRIPCLKVSRDSTAATPKDERAERDSLHFSSRNSKWLDESVLVNRPDGKETEWKQQYKLKHNWTIGRPTRRFPDINLQDWAGKEGLLLVRLVEGVVVTADPGGGVRAWNLTTGICFAQLELNSGRTPFSLAVDSNIGTGLVGVAVGYTDGGWATCELDLTGNDFRNLQEQAGNTLDSDGLSQLAYSYPYLLAYSPSKRLSLWVFEKTPPKKGDDAEGIHNATSSDPGKRWYHAVYPRNLATKDSDEMPEKLEPLPATSTNSPDEDKPSHPTAYPRLIAAYIGVSIQGPITLSIRTTPSSVICSVVYQISVMRGRWGVAMQELRVDPTTGHRLKQVRVAYSYMNTPPAERTGNPLRRYLHEHAPPKGKGEAMTSLSYSHPYLLCSHADNTLTLFLVTSTMEKVEISTGERLWGHTSSVSGAAVGGRGAAVSVSLRGNEVRYWELEGHIGSSAVRRQAGPKSVKIMPEQADEEDDLKAKKSWLGFDAERVVVLKESHNEGSNALIVYNFRE